MNIIFKKETSTNKMYTPFLIGINLRYGPYIKVICSDIWTRGQVFWLKDARLKIRGDDDQDLVASEEARHIVHTVLLVRVHRFM